MTHVVIASRSFISYLNASLGLAHRLVRLGHRVTFVCYEESLRERVERQGFDFVHLSRDREISARSEGLIRPSIASPSALISWVREKRRLRAEGIENREIEETLQALQADVFVADHECHFAIICGVQLGLPTILTSVLFNVYRNASAPPLNSALIPNKKLLSRIAVTIAWMKLRAQTRWLSVRRRLSVSGLFDFVRPVDYRTINPLDLAAIARDRGFSLSHHVDSTHFMRPFVYTRLPLLYLCPGEFEFPMTLRPNVHYIGAGQRKADEFNTLSDQEKQRWDALLKRRTKDPDRKLIYCSLGSYVRTDLELLERIISVFRERTKWDLVVGLGGKANADQLQNLPTNVFAFEWAPQLEILAMADAAITHGGSSSILECLRLGVPMVACSTRYLDQNGNAARVAYHRVGLVGDALKDSTEELDSLINTVLTDDEIQSAVKRFSLSTGGELDDVRLMSLFDQLREDGDQIA